MTKSNDKQKSGFKRTLIEWGSMASVLAILYATGLHTEVLATLQRAALWTGLLSTNAKKIEVINGPMLSERTFRMPLKTRNNNLLKLSSFKGKVLFVNVWASWCPPCVAEMPTIESLYNAVSDNKDISFLLISVDKNHKDAVAFMSGKEYPMPYYFPMADVPKVFRGKYIPSTYVISKEGKMVYRHEGINDYSSDTFREWLLTLADE